MMTLPELPSSKKGDEDVAGEIFKEVCANFGAAMYFAQVLEHGIANALVFLDLIPRTGAKWTDEEFDAYSDDHFAKTLGNLIKALKAVSTLPAGLEGALLEAKDRRAFLAHHFFRERIDALHVGHHAEVLGELESHRAFFEATDRELQEFMWPVMREYGFTEERLEQAVREYRSHLGIRPAELEPE